MITLQPAFSGEEIPVAFTCDARFLPNTAVLLQSLMEQAALCARAKGAVHG